MMLSPTGRLLVRGPDSVARSGGAFGASRVKRGKPYAHRGVDLNIEPWQVLIAPARCEVLRIGIAYDGDLRFHSILLIFDAHLVKVLYAWPYYLAGTPLKRGQVFALAEDLTARYPKITNHIHMQLRRGSVKPNRWIDPLPHLEVA